MLFSRIVMSLVSGHSIYKILFIYLLSLSLFPVLCPSVHPSVCSTVCPFPPCAPHRDCSHLHRFAYVAHSKPKRLFPYILSTRRNQVCCTKISGSFSVKHNKHGHCEYVRVSQFYTINKVYKTHFN